MLFYWKSIDSLNNEPKLNITNFIILIITIFCNLDGSVSLSPVPKKKNTGTLDLTSKTQSNTHLMIRTLSPDVEMVDLGASRSSASAPGPSSKKNKKKGLYTNNKHNKTNNENDK